MSDTKKQLEQRLGRIHARQRLGIEADYGHRVFGKGINFFHPENWYSAHSIIKFILQISGMYERGKRNARNIRIRNNNLSIEGLPGPFENYTILHLSDLHVDMYPAATDALLESLATIKSDICVMTGDYRARTFGSIDQTMQGMKRVAEAIRTPIYAVLGNHDSVSMLPGLEASGIQVLMNESVEIIRDGQTIYLCGVDDAHYFRVENIAQAMEDVPDNAVSILLSHTPEIYRQATHAGVTFMLCGHTHGGQICLPGGVPLTLDASCPRFMGNGAWRYGNMRGYTSVGCGTSIVNARFNCLPEITLHRLTANLPG